MIVVIGVYCAFLIQRYAENVKSAKERNRIVTALKYEIEVFRYQMSQTSIGMANYHKELEGVREKEAYRDFSNYRFIEPQYDYQTLQYALNLENSEIIDFELYKLLQSLLVEIRKVEHTERLLTDVAAHYRSVPASLSRDSESYLLMHSENMDLFDRFIIFIEDRANGAARIYDASIQCLAEIDAYLGNDAAKQIEKKLIKQGAPAFGSKEKAMILGRQLFPKFTEEELGELYDEAIREAGKSGE